MPNLCDTSADLARSLVIVFAELGWRPTWLQRFESITNVTNKGSAYYGVVARSPLPQPFQFQLRLCCAAMSR